MQSYHYEWNTKISGIHVRILLHSCKSSILSCHVAYSPCILNALSTAYKSRMICCMQYNRKCIMLYTYITNRVIECNCVCVWSLSSEMLYFWPVRVGQLSMCGQQFGSLSRGDVSAVLRK